MERNELAEWIVMILIIASWWPKIFIGYGPVWYNLVVYLVGPIVLVAIFVVRYRRVREGFEYSENVIKAQHKAAGRDHLGGEQQGPVSPYPGVPMPPPENQPGDDSKPS